MGGGGVKLAPIKPSHQFFERGVGKSIFFFTEYFFGYSVLDIR